MALIDKSNFNHDDKWWLPVDNISANSIIANKITSTGPFGAGKYEGLPNFVGGLYVEEGMLKLMKKDNSIVILGKASDIASSKELLLSIIDKFFSD